MSRKHHDPDPFAHLSEEQKSRIVEMAVETTIHDMEQDHYYAVGVAVEYVGADVAGALELLGWDDGNPAGDEALKRKLGFDPRTGKPAIQKEGPP